MQIVTNQHFSIGELSDSHRQSICRRVSTKQDISLADANIILDDLLVFLSASAAWPETRFSPPPQMDDLWHEFILHTHAYIDFCQSVSIAYIHHVPHGDINSVLEDVTGPQLNHVFDELGISYTKQYWENFDAECHGCDKGIARAQDQNLRIAH